MKNKEKSIDIENVKYNIKISKKWNIKKIKIKEQGITLVALVVTIIILLILTGVTLNLALSDNGLFEKTKEAVEKYEEAEDEEENAIDKLSDKLEKINIATNLKIGDTVKYEPKEKSYTWKIEYCSSGDENVGQTDVSRPSIDVVLSNKDENFQVTEWKVFDIDKKNGIITLISANPTKGTVYLGGAQGYNNAVKLLNDACNTLYGNSEKGINGRSIKIEDIENNLNPRTLNEIHNFIHQDTNSTTKYGEQVKDAFTTFKYYPSIYKKELKSEIDDELNQTGLDRSEQVEFVKEDEDEATNGLIEATMSIKPYQTYWDLGRDYGIETSFKDVRIYNLLISQGGETRYYIASRNINTRELRHECDFNVFTVEEGLIDGDPFIYGASWADEYWAARMV